MFYFKILYLYIHFLSFIHSFGFIHSFTKKQTTSPAYLLEKHKLSCSVCDVVSWASGVSSIRAVTVPFTLWLALTAGSWHPESLTPSQSLFIGTLLTRECNSEGEKNVASFLACLVFPLPRAERCNRLNCGQGFILKTIIYWFSIPKQCWKI